LLTGGFDIWEDEPMVLGRYGRFVCFSQGLSENQLFSRAPLFQKFTKTFGLVRLKYIVTTDQDQLQVLPLPFKILPRMLLLDKWDVQPDGQKILGDLFKREFQPDESAYLESDPGFSPRPGGGKGWVRWRDLSSENIEVTADLPKPEMLLITDNFSSGWRVKAGPSDSQGPYRILPMDTFLQSVPLSGGKHHFFLEYRPWAFEWGKWVSILSCILYLGMLLFGWKKGKLTQTKAVP
jgi:hypothetical protein